VSPRELVRRCLVAAVSALIAALALKAAPVAHLCTGAACLLIGLVAAASYAFAALVTADGLPVAWRVALGSPVVVLFAWGVVRPIVL
jgi:hypothetical protein